MRTTAHLRRQIAKSSPFLCMPEILPNGKRRRLIARAGGAFAGIGLSGQETGFQTYSALRVSQERSEDVSFQHEREQGGAAMGQVITVDEAIFGYPVVGVEDGYSVLSG